MSLSSFSPLSAFATALFGGVFAFLAIVFKQWYDHRSEKLRYQDVLLAESEDIAEHFGRNIKRLEAMISVLRDGDGLWPEKLHIQKLFWPQDTAFFNPDILKFFSVGTANNIAKFRLRLRNANLDVDPALRVYDMQNTEALLTVLEYVRERSSRIKALAASALRNQSDAKPETSAIAVGHYRTVKDMIFLPKPILFARKGTD